MKRFTYFLFFSFFFFGTDSFCQSDSVLKKSITVHFLYGSRPAHGFKDKEGKTFGGIHGGHVSIQIDTVIFSFVPKYGWHIFPKHHDIKGGYILEDAAAWARDTSGDKYTSIQIPISDSQLVLLNNFKSKVLSNSPYDYAFLGMRCASSAADVLAHLGILKKRTNFGYIRKNFYPKRLRRKLLRYAKHDKLIVVRKPGRKSRKWERE